MAAVLGKEQKGYLVYMSERRRASPIKKHETERPNSQIAKKQMVLFCFESSISCFDIVRL